MVKNKIVFGTFNSEKYWENEKCCKLPTLHNPNSQNQVLYMDELLFLLCDKGDLLITRNGHSKGFKDYLSEIGFEFDWVSVAKKVGQDDCEQKIETLILNECYNNDFAKKLKGYDGIKPFSIMQETEEILVRNDYNMRSPKIDIIKKVNSKEFSCKLANKVCSNYKGNVVYSSKELKELGERYLKEGPIIVKECFGVSGKGSLKIKKQSILNRTVKHIHNQEKEGKICTFVLEPFLDKAMDFSVQFDISADGNKKTSDLQEMKNIGLAYKGTQDLTKEQADKIYTKGYLNIVEETLDELIKNGYYGHGCIDSMLLSDGELIEVLEINARQTMGGLKEKLDNFIKQYDVKSMVCTYQLSSLKDLSFDEFLWEMNRKNILFKPSQHVKGIIILSYQQQTNKIYLAFVYQDICEVTTYREEFISILNARNIQVF